MSDAISALAGARFDGIALIEEMGPRGMITLRGDLADKTLVAAATGATGATMPGPREARIAGDGGLLWMSPDELMVLVPHHRAAQTAADLAKALAGQHALAVDVSDARAMFRISGTGAREVLAKLAPVDFSPEAFAPGRFRRTRAAQVPAAIWLEEDGAFRLVCFRSVAAYAFGILSTAAKPGSGVGVWAGPA